jgi:transcriptional regulator with XRE-family HTH domain
MCPVSILEKFGSAIRDLRVSRGWSQEQLAERAQLDRSYMSGIERGRRNVSILAAVRICRALRVPLSALLSDTAAGEPSGSDQTPAYQGADRLGTRARGKSIRRAAAGTDTLLGTPRVSAQLTALDALTELIRTVPRPVRLLRLGSMARSGYQVRR